LNGELVRVVKELGEVQEQRVEDNRRLEASIDKNKKEGTAQRMELKTAQLQLDTELKRELARVLAELGEVQELRARDNRRLEASIDEL